MSGATVAPVEVFTERRDALSIRFAHIQGRTYRALLDVEFQRFAETVSIPEAGVNPARFASADRLVALWRASQIRAGVIDGEGRILRRGGRH